MLQVHKLTNYSLRLTRSWYFRYGSLTYQFLLFQKEVVILSKSLLCVLLQNTCSLRRFRLAGFFFHSFFLYPAYLHPKTRQYDVFLISFVQIQKFLAVNNKATVPCVWSKGHSEASETFLWQTLQTSSSPSSRCSMSNFCLVDGSQWEEVPTPCKGNKGSA